MKLPHFPFYAGDWLSSNKIAGMTYEQQGIYIHLLCRAWLDPTCSIPSDKAVIKTWLKVPGLDDGLLAHVLEAFEAHELPNRLHNPRLTAERSKADRVYNAHLTALKGVQKERMAEPLTPLVPTVATPEVSVSKERLDSMLNGVFAKDAPTYSGTAGEEIIRQLMQTAGQVTKMPNKPDTIRKVFEGLRARYGGEVVLTWLMDTKNVGKNVNEMQDDLRPRKKGMAEAATPAVCRNCGGKGEIPHETEVKDGRTVVVSMRECPGCRGKGK